MLSPYAKLKQFGFSLAEMLVVILIVGILAAIAVPNFRIWMINSQIRNAAESISNGLQRARAEAVARNTNVAFSLSMAAPQDSSWYVYTISPASGIDSRLSNEGSTAVSLTVTPTGSTTVTFNSFGNALLTNPGTVVPATGAAVPATPFTTVGVSAVGGTKNLQVEILLPSNIIKMCDPAAASTSSSSC